VNEGGLRCRKVGLLVLLMLAGCAGGTGGGIPPLLPRSGATPGWPYGESGRGTVQHLPSGAEDPDYGWTPSLPVPLGGSEWGESEVWDRQMSYLNSLWGPEGQILFYERLGSCCPFDHPGAPLDRGTLDVYEIKWDGLVSPRHLYLDRFREGAVLLPAGLTSKVPPR